MTAAFLPCLPSLKWEQIHGDNMKKGVVCQFGYLDHREFMSKTTWERKHFAERRFCKAVLTETTETIGNFLKKNSE